MLALELGGRFDGFFNVFGQGKRKEIAGGMQMIFLVFVNHPDKPFPRGIGVGELLIDLTELQGGLLAFVVDANDKLSRLSVSFHRLNRGSA
jgi:hypothetical protein